MLKTTLLAVLTTALLSTITIGTETLVPMQLVNHTNANETIVCDYCLSHTGEHDHNHHFTDANGDGICDYYPIIPEYDASSNAASPSTSPAGTYSHHNSGCGDSHRNGHHR